MNLFGDRSEKNSSYLHRPATHTCPFRALTYSVNMPLHPPSLPSIFDGCSMVLGLDLVSSFLVSRHTRLVHLRDGTRQDLPEVCVALPREHHYFIFGSEIMNTGLLLGSGTRMFSSRFSQLGLPLAVLKSLQSVS